MSIDTCPKKSANFVCSFFFTGKYKTTRQPKKSGIFSVGEKMGGQARKTLDRTGFYLQTLQSNVCK
jgi:hypothetical protein